MDTAQKQMPVPLPIAAGVPATRRRLAPRALWFAQTWIPAWQLLRGMLLGPDGFAFRWWCDERVVDFGDRDLRPRGEAGSRTLHFPSCRNHFCYCWYLAPRVIPLLTLLCRRSIAPNGYGCAALQGKRKLKVRS